MSTIREIAEKANLSIATVSKVLNGKSGVSDETRQLILNVAQELSYRPNLNARNLKAGCSRTIGIITEDLTVFNSPEIVDGIAAACDAAGYHYILGNLRLFKRYGNGPKDLRETTALVHAAVDDMLSKQVDGIIYIGCHSHVVISLSEHADAKFVCAYCICKDETVPSVIYNDEKAAYDLTELLLKHGYQHIGMVTGPVESVHTLNRSRGHMRALYDHGILYDPTLTLTGDWERDCGYELGGQLIRSGVNAIFAHNDLMAMGVLDYCNEKGINVGRDLQLIGFDNREIASVCRPQLSSVAPPLFEIGQTAAREMLNILAGNKPAQHEILLDCTIIERESTFAGEKK
ncbi:MAG: LacI family DNA-binding transcriptional regulator [Oscillospiraceae bacterium]|nr:LacI family DNA-binding transcriptional regulator [Oscillospiraceae bacterium]